VPPRWALRGVPAERRRRLRSQASPRRAIGGHGPSATQRLPALGRRRPPAAVLSGLAPSNAQSPEFLGAPSGRNGSSSSGIFGDGRGRLRGPASQGPRGASRVGLYSLVGFLLAFRNRKVGPNGKQGCAWPKSFETVVAFSRSRTSGRSTSPVRAGAGVVRTFLARTSRRVSKNPPVRATPNFVEGLVRWRVIRCDGSSEGRTRK